MSPHEVSIVTCADAPFFFGLQLLVHESRRVYPGIEIVCGDLGLTDEQRIWLKAQAVECFEPVEFRRDVRNWHWWAKPRVIQQAERRHVLWLDADAALLQPIPEVFHHYRYYGLTLTSNVTQWLVRQRQEIVHRFFGTEPVYRPLLNSGVLMIDTHREGALLDDWITHCDAIQSQAHPLVLGDQGVLQWLVDRRGLYAGQQLREAIYNWRESAVDTKSPERFLESLRKARARCKIWHLWGRSKAFWKRWTLPCDEPVENGTEVVAGAPQPAMAN